MGRLSKKIKSNASLRKTGTSGKGVNDIKSDKQFSNAVLSSDIPVIVDFWAPWCAPCRSMAPVFEATAREFEGRVRFVKVNTEATPSIAQAYGISSIPSLLVFDGGEVADARVGMASKSQLGVMLQRVLDKHNGVGFMDKLKRRFGGKTDAQAQAV